MKMPGKIAIIGAGTLGTAIANGLVSGGVLKADQITLTRRNGSMAANIETDGFNFTTDNKSAVREAEIILICVRPNQMDDVLEEIKLAVKPHQIVVSTVTGYNLSVIRAKFPNPPTLIRAMPNTAVIIRESMTCLSASPNTDQSQLEMVMQLFDQVGRTIIIHEDLMAAATSLCACGIAFFLRAIRAAAQGGVQVGFHAEEAILMAAQTARGASSLIVHNNAHPETEVDKVTTPEGCTIVGLNHMEHKGFSSAMIQGIVLSSEKAEQLLNQNKK